ncbi:MAG: FAD-dependent oxidoreductase [Thermoleophilia bacterium]|nr:FAD-dependent oxidoreductase [Thermoleophilia bacterium]
MSDPADRRVLVAGGGVAALEAVLTLRELAQGRLEIVLLSPSPRFDYVPLSVAEPFDLGRAHRFELRELLRGRGVNMIIDSLERVDPVDHVVHTNGGLNISYDALLVAVGAHRRSALPGAITFSGSRASADTRNLLRDATAGAVERIAFVVPSEVTWPLPAYELALMTAAHLAERKVEATLALVTPEPRPVDVFGARSSAAVAEMMDLRGVSFHSAVPVYAEPDHLIVEQGEPIPADAVVALPRIVAPEIPGLPRDQLGFLPVDDHGRVRDLAGVYAAGDVTSFPLKQGGIATQQADATAEAIVADLGGDVRPDPFRPVLRGLLLAGRAPRHLRAEVLRGQGGPSMAPGGAIRRPPAKITGRRLGPLLALQGVSGGPPPETVALELDASWGSDEEEAGGWPGS